jgi:hypothetical protein
VPAYVAALMHYAVPGAQCPEGLPHVVHQADDCKADLPDTSTAAQSQSLVWHVVRADLMTLVAP